LCDVPLDPPDQPVLVRIFRPDLHERGHSSRLCDVPLNPPDQPVLVRISV